MRNKTVWDVLAGNCFYSRSEKRKTWQQVGEIEWKLSSSEERKSFSLESWNVMPSTHVEARDSQPLRSQSLCLQQNLQNLLSHGGIKSFTGTCALLWREIIMNERRIFSKRWRGSSKLRQSNFGQTFLRNNVNAKNFSFRDLNVTSAYRHLTFDCFKEFNCRHSKRGDSAMWQKPSKATANLQIMISPTSMTKIMTGGLDI